MPRSEFLSSLPGEERAGLERRLLDRQSGKCFICQELIDLLLHQGELEIDHIIPLADQGPDEENNFALTHATCNRTKGASDLRVARRVAEFEKLQAAARRSGARGANLGHVLDRYMGARSKLRLKKQNGRVEYVLLGTDDSAIHTAPLYRDPLSNMEYFFAVLPLAFIHHDDRINPRSIGGNVRALIEEFMKKRPQLHVGLAWWAPEEDGSGEVKMFDGQHKAAAQILLGAKALPVRIFVEPDTNVLLQANTNAGDKLRQVAFDTAVLRQLGSKLYIERVRQYQAMKGHREDQYSFSEQDLVQFFRGERREMTRYIVDAVRSKVVTNRENILIEFMEWSGKAAEKPLSYTTVERTFFAEFLYNKALDVAMGEGYERGDYPRLIEEEQLVKLMSVFADVCFVGQWDPDVGGRRLESRVQKGEPVPEAHLRAWRMAREEVLAGVLRYVRMIIENFFALDGRIVDRGRLFQTRFPENVWRRIELFFRRLSELPCWVDKELSRTVFGAKQNREYWQTVFETGRAPSDVPVLAQPIDVMKMILETPREVA